MGKNNNNSNMIKSLFKYTALKLTKKGTVNYLSPFSEIVKCLYKLYCEMFVQRQYNQLAMYVSEALNGADTTVYKNKPLTKLVKDNNG